MSFLVGFCWRVAVWGVGKAEYRAFLLVDPVLQELHAVLVLDLQVFLVSCCYVFELRAFQVPVDVDVARQFATLV
jgi:hypothetical protein